MEGDTEYYAILEILPEPSRVGIELVNLRGAVRAGKHNVPLKLQDLLADDKKLRRFSILSFDLDVRANVNAVKRQIQLNNVVGYIGAYKPDFEFSNFRLRELVQIAAALDESNGVSGDAVRHADWSSIDGGDAFEARYIDVSARKPRGLKGEQWGRALARYTTTHPRFPRSVEDRPFWSTLRAALQCRRAHYAVQTRMFTFDPTTFQLVKT